MVSIFINRMNNETDAIPSFVTTSDTYPRGETCLMEHDYLVGPSIDDGFRPARLDILDEYAE
jgi:hypothetical protein